MATLQPLVINGGQLQRLQAGDSTLNVGAFAPGAFALADGQFVMMTKRLILTTNQRVTLAGTSRVSVSG